MSVGNWNANAQANIMRVYNDSADDTRGRNSTNPFAKLAKKRDAAGQLTYWENAAPPTKHTVAHSTNGIASRFSWTYRPGARNSHAAA